MNRTRLARFRGCLAAFAAAAAAALPLPSAGKRSASRSMSSIDLPRRTSSSEVDRRLALFVGVEGVGLRLVVSRNKNRVRYLWSEEKYKYSIP